LINQHYIDFFGNEPSYARAQMVEIIPTTREIWTRRWKINRVHRSCPQSSPPLLTNHDPSHLFSSCDLQIMFSTNLATHKLPEPRVMRRASVDAADAPPTCAVAPASHGRGRRRTPPSDSGEKPNQRRVQDIDGMDRPVVRPLDKGRTRCLIA
jgi:hypothetical protein